MKITKFKLILPGLVCARGRPGTAALRAALTRNPIKNNPLKLSVARESAESALFNEPLCKNRVLK